MLDFFNDFASHELWMSGVQKDKGVLAAGRAGTFRNDGANRTLPVLNPQELHQLQVGVFFVQFYSFFFVESLKITNRTRFLSNAFFVFVFLCAHVCFVHAPSCTLFGSY